MFIEILFKIVLFKGGVLIYAEHCMLNVQKQYFLHAHSSMSVDVLAKASLGSVSDLFCQDQTH